MIYQYLGQVLVVLALLVATGTALLAGLVYYMWRTNRILMPRVVLIMLRTFEWPVKALLGNEKVDKITVDLANRVYNRAYRQVPYAERVVFLPQCLRNTDCPAKLSVEGIACVSCGKCAIGSIKAELSQHNIPVFIVPGTSFIKRLIKKYRPTAVVGVGCMLEVKEGMSLVADAGLIPQGVTLSKDGCVATTVRWKSVRKLALSR
jgi:uncharacterized protein